MSRFRLLTPLLSAFLVFSTQAARAEGLAGGLFSKCGTYRVQGRVDASDPDRVVLVVFGGSQSETRLSVRGGSSLRGREGERLLVEGRILRTVQNYRGEIEVASIRRAVPDLIRADEGDGFQILKARACAKAGR